MKKIYNCTITSLFMLIMLVQAGNAQNREVIIEPNIVDNIAIQLAADKAARDAASQLTTYVLRRDGFYPNQTLNEIDFTFHLKAEDGEGALPIVQPAPRADGNFGDIFNIRADSKLENIEFNAARLGGGNQNRMIEVRDGADLEVIGSVFHEDRGACVSIRNDSSSVWLRDCIGHSFGHPRSGGGNGRLIDVRADAYVDTLSIVNCTVFNQTDRLIRNMAPVINTVIVDHVTYVNSYGRHGGLQLGKTRHATVTNNIIIDPILFASDSRLAHAKGSWLREQTQPENYSNWAVTLDTVYANGSLTVANNNIVYTQEFRDMVAKHDSVDVPGTITATILNALGADSVNAYFSEDLTFAVPAAKNLAFADSMISNEDATEFPENWFFGPLDSLDYSYGTAAASYTASGGFPLGDLNWYPDRKAAWEAAGMPTSVEGDNTVPADFALEQNYPNPFNPATNIAYKLSENSNVSLVVYNTLGQNVRTLVNGNRLAGSYTVSWDGKNEYGVQMSSGIYFYSLKTETLTTVKKMLLLK